VTLTAGAQRALQRWDGSEMVEAAIEMSALTLDVVGRALFGADLAAQAPALGRALAGQGILSSGSNVFPDAAGWTAAACVRPPIYIP
jgi:hypothetical protein